jgi:hypothetical protein
LRRNKNNTQEKKSINMISEWNQMLALADTTFKSATERNKNIFKDLQENITTMNHQIKNISKVIEL